MAGTTPGVIGWGSSDGENIDATMTRWSTASRVDLVGGATALSTRGGIHPAGGTPLAVQAQGTPARSIVLKAGSMGIAGNSPTLPPAGVLTLTADQTLATDPEHATLPRLDRVVGRIINPGTNAAAGDFFILTGTANASPTLPTLPTGTSHCHSIGTLLVQPATVRSVIQAGDILRTQSDTWTNDTSDVFWLTGPGGTVLGPTDQAGTGGNLMAMTATRRQAWAALYAPGTRWVDTVARVEGFIAGGDIVPTSLVRVLQQDGSGGFANNTTPVTAMTSGSIPARPGGSRRIMVTVQGQMTMDAATSGQFVSGRVYMDGSGITDIVPAANLRSEYQARLEGDTAGAITRQTINATWHGTAAGAFQADIKILKEGGTATWFYLSDVRMTIWDMGPA